MLARHTSTDLRPSFFLSAIPRLPQAYMTSSACLMRALFSTAPTCSCFSALNILHTTAWHPPARHQQPRRFCICPPLQLSMREFMSWHPAGHACIAATYELAVSTLPFNSPSYNGPSPQLISSLSLRCMVGPVTSEDISTISGCHLQQASSSPFALVRTQKQNCSHASCYN